MPAPNDDDTPGNHSADLNAPADDGVTADSSVMKGLPAGYGELLGAIKARVQTAQLRTALAVNTELVLLYWSIGRDILARQAQEGWGAKVIARLAADLRRAFPDMKGFSRTNLLYMRAFAESYPDEPFVQQVAGQIPWFHNCTLLDKVKGREEREWYLRATKEYGWSRAMLVHQIETKLFERQGKALTNFERTLPAPQSDLARQTLKKPYTLDFLALGKDAQERAIERGLVEHIRDFLLELGQGFAFVGSQYPLEVAGQEFALDMLFYHLKLRCYVVIELKAVEFAPEFVGKLNFYLSAVDDLLRHADDQPTLGLLLCKSKNQVLAEYALRDVGKPMGISVYQLTQALPERIKSSLPSIEELEAELADIADDEKPDGNDLN